MPELLPVAREERWRAECIYLCCLHKQRRRRRRSNRCVVCRFAGVKSQHPLALCSFGHVKSKPNEENFRDKTLIIAAWVLYSGHLDLCQCAPLEEGRKPRLGNNKKKDGFMSLKVTGVYFSASSAGPGPGKMKATIRAARQHNHHHHHHPHHHHPHHNHAMTPTQQSPLPPTDVPQQQQQVKGRSGSGANHSHLHSQSLDYLHLNFQEKRQIIASSLSLVDFLHPTSKQAVKPVKIVKVKGTRAVPKRLGPSVSRLYCSRSYVALGVS